MGLQLRWRKETSGLASLLAARFGCYLASENPVKYGKPKSFASSPTSSRGMTVQRVVQRSKEMTGPGAYAISRIVKWSRTTRGYNERQKTDRDVDHTLRKLDRYLLITFLKSSWASVSRNVRQYVPFKRIVLVVTTNAFDLARLMSNYVSSVRWYLNIFGNNRMINYYWNKEFMLYEHGVLCNTNKDDFINFLWRLLSILEIW